MRLNFISCNNLNMHSLITITTDFGDQFAAAQLRAVIASLNFDGQVIENHSVTPFNISEGAFELLTLAKFCPSGSVHVGVVDPGVGSQRKGIIIKTEKSWLVGPDNGLLYPLAKKETIQRVWQLQESKVSDYVSQTFHGRDVFIKAAAYLAHGKSPEEFSCLNIDSETLEKLDFKPGQVLHIDHYGNVKVYWPEKTQLDKTLEIKSHQKIPKLPIVNTFSDVPSGQPLALWGSSDTLEIAVNLGNAAKSLQINSGDCLDIDYII